MITSIKSPFLEYKMTILRNKKTSNSLFRQTMNEASYLIAAEVLKHLKYKKVTIQTPLTKTVGKDLAQQVILVPILRAGLGLLEGFVKFLPDAEKGHIGLYRDEQTYEPVEYLFKLPKTKNKKVLVIDDVLTAGTALKQSLGIISKSGGEVSGCLVALDREEKIDGVVAREKIQQEFDIDILSCLLYTSDAADE